MNFKIYPVIRPIQSLLAALGLVATSFAGLAPSVAQAQLSSYCQLSAEAIASKETLRQSAAEGDASAQNSYKTLIQEHAQQLRNCRSRTWPQTQAIWIRLYPCDARPGALEAIFDQIVNRGYNQVYVEVFSDSQVLLPSSDNPTAWLSVLRSPGYENRDLFAEAIAKGHERGLKVYAWMFTLNFGYAYSQRPESSQTLAVNGWGQTTLTAGANGVEGANYEEVFVDPYNAQAKRDYYDLVQAILKRNPDGVLFDYVRYPMGQGAASVAGHVKDLWIYGSGSQQALLQRALNQRGLELIRRFLAQGYITANDISSIEGLYPDEGEPAWQGRLPSLTIDAAPPEQVQPYLQAELWQLSVAHAIQGVLDFLSLAAYPVQEKGLPAGAVFFPEGNQVVGDAGYDSRLQAWDRFPGSLEWHPMAYAVCGRADCITAQVEKVLSHAPAGTRVMPVLAGTWGQFLGDHPPLEQQMQGLQHLAPQISNVSHFAYSWQEPQSDRNRKFCQLR